MKVDDDMECVRCRKEIKVEQEIKKNVVIHCENCGCVMKCLDINEYISRWKTVNHITLEQQKL